MKRLQGKNQRPKVRISMLFLGVALVSSILLITSQFTSFNQAAFLYKPDTLRSNYAAVDQACGSIGMRRNSTTATRSIPKLYNEIWGKAPENSMITATGPPPEHLWLLQGAGNNENQVTTKRMIPMVIHKMFLSKSGGFLDLHHDQPENLRKAHQSWINNNPGYTLQYFDLTTARHYLAEHFHPIFLRAFDCIEPFAGKADLFRLVVVYREGGWYSDWKEQCNVPGLLGNMTTTANNENPGVVFFWDRGLPASRQGEYIMNAFFGAAPQHPFIAESLRLVFIHVQSQFYGETLPTENTGPGLLGQAWKNIRERSPDAASNGGAVGIYKWNFYYYQKTTMPGLENQRQPIIQHKCTECTVSETRGWGDGGNDYWKMHADKTWYCQDAASLFETTK